MKKILTLAAIIIAAQSAFAQNDNEQVFKKFKVDVSFGYVKPQSKVTKDGALFVIEPKYAVMDQLSIGLRMEAAATARISNDNNSVTTVKANGSYLVTGDYYFNNNKFRPFIGAGAGVYTTASVDDTTNINTAADIPTSSKFGFMTRVGFEYGHLRLGVEYNFVAENSGYLGLKLGVCIGGGRKE